MRFFLCRSAYGCAPASTPTGENRAGRGPRAYGSEEVSRPPLTRPLAPSAQGRLGHMPDYYQSRLAALESRMPLILAASANIFEGDTEAEERQNRGFDHYGITPKNVFMSRRVFMVKRQHSFQGEL